ncbi:MAG: diguanylate cyclase [Gemmatimonadaceae bacterium]
MRVWLEGKSLPLVSASSPAELIAMALRGRPRLVIFDARENPSIALSACRELKTDSYSAIVPTVCITADDISTGMAFDAGADEVLHEVTLVIETHRRLDLLLRRSDRDVYVHPSTRLPGTIEIEAEIERRLHAAGTFAVCYADLDHFKEFNDRYSYYDGDRVIKILANLLHDVVKGLCFSEGFVGHIGGDDFIFIIPASRVSEVCSEIVSVFDLLIPLQYSDQDRRAGYFFGKDRRGQLHRVPLMTLSIGVVTNERRMFATASQVSELATEMKGYAKTLTGSVFTVDRRQDLVSGSEPTPPRSHQSISVVED